MAMLETAMQQLIIDAVKDVGGAGIKLNNRFLVGVVDLLIKLPNCRPMWLEAKQIALSDRTKNHVWELDVTTPQRKFLKEWHGAGMLTGVVSFIQTKGAREPIKTLRMALYTYEVMEHTSWQVMQRSHVPLGDKDGRLGKIRAMLGLFAEYKNVGQV